MRRSCLTGLGPEPLDFRECDLDDLDDALAVASRANFPGSGPIQASGVGGRNGVSVPGAEAALALDADGGAESALIIVIDTVLGLVAVQGGVPLV
jgi:hypothetical protein